MNSDPNTTIKEDIIETSDLEKLNAFIVEYEHYFSQTNAPLDLEPEMLDGYVKRNNLTDEQRAFLMDRPHYIYASQAMDILTGKFSTDDYYLIRNRNYYTKLLSDFLPEEILKTKILDKYNNFKHLQQAKQERNIYDVNVLDAHGSLEHGYTQVPAGIALCFTTQPFHYGFGSVESLLYQLQNTEIIKPLITHPMCYGKHSDNDTFKNMVVYYPGQMVPNISFSPDINPKSNFFKTMGYYSATDISKRPITYDTSTNKYKLDKTKTQYMAMAISKHNTLTTALKYKSFNIMQVMAGTSYIGKVSGIIIIDSCRSSEVMTSYEHELLNRYEIFISMLNYIIDECGTKNKSNVLAAHGSATSSYNIKFKYYDKIMKRHIPMFDYRLLPDYMFSKLTNKSFDYNALKLSLKRRAFKIRVLIDKYNKNRALQMLKAERLVLSMYNRVPELLGEYDNSSLDIIIRDITALIQLEYDYDAMKLLEIFMDNPDQTSKQLHDIYYEQLHNILELATTHKCILTIKYMLENDAKVLNIKLVHFIDNFLTTTVDSAKDMISYIKILILFIDTAVNSAKLDNKYVIVTKLLKHFKTPKDITLLFQTVKNYDKSLNTIYYNMESYSKVDTTKLSNVEIKLLIVHVPLYYLYLRSIIYINSPDYKQKVEYMFNILVDNGLNINVLMTGSDYTLHVIPYLCKEFMDNKGSKKTKPHDTSLWGLGKLVSLIANHKSIDYPIYNHQTLVILRRALETNNRAVIVLMMRYVYPKNRAEAKYAFILAATKPKWFSLLLDSLPFQVPEYVQYLNSNHPGRPAIRNVLPKKILALLNPNPDENTLNNTSQPSESESEIEESRYNNPDNNILEKYAHKIKQMTSKLRKPWRRRSKKNSK